METRESIIKKFDGVVEFKDEESITVGHFGSWDLFIDEESFSWGINTLCFTSFPLSEIVINADKSHFFVCMGENANSLCWRKG